MNATIHILDHGRRLDLDYAALLAYHGGGALAGAAIAFRALGCAAQALSTRQPWDRQHLTVTSWHDGPGVRDAIEFVTRALTRGHFELREDRAAHNCAAHSAFHFQIDDGRQMAEIRLREGVLSARFFELATRADRNDVEERELAQLKQDVAAAVMAAPAERLFELAVREDNHA